MRPWHVPRAVAPCGVAIILGALGWAVLPGDRVDASAARAAQVPPVVAPAMPPAPVDAVGASPAPALIRGLPSAADKVVDYRISVKLDREKKQLTGRQRLTWQNPSDDAVPDLWFHLYLNAFKNSKSTFFRESGGQLRGDQMDEDGWGWIDITSMKLANGTDLTRAIRFEAPDDGNADDQSVARIVLPQPVPPRGSVVLDIEFVAQLPRVFARTGYKDDFYMVGQWFPKMGVYEPAGVRGRTTGGWNCHQFHANSEFYADYGRYEVDISVPRGFVLGATGRRTATRENQDGTVTYTHVQDNVHDFAWTTSPDYVEQRRVFSDSLDVTPEEYARVAQLVGRSVDEVRLSDVEVILLVQPPHLPQAERYFQSAKLAIKWFGLWYGRYPYQTLTVVDPAPGAAGAGGMEYPTLITGGTSFLLNGWPLGGIRAPEMVTVHEFGHNFWYGLVGNNEFEEAWLDEGVNSYSTAKVMEVGYGRETAMVDIPWLRVGNESASFMNSLAARYDRVRQPAWSYSSSGNYGFYSYQKPELLLRTLEHYLGEPTMARIMRTYHERWRFRHPSSDDFYAVAHEVSGQDLRWFFDQAVEGTAVLDYEVSRASSQRVRTDMGHLDGPKGRTFVSRKDARERDEASEDTPGQYESTVIVRRRGDFIFPVEIAFKFEGKPAERTTWDGRDTWKRFTFVRKERLEWAQVDPDGKVMLDANWLNNGRRVEADRRVAAAASLKWLASAQAMLALLGW